MATDTSREHSQRRRELLASAEAAVRRHGAAVTMTQMAAEAGITKPVLYRHFGSKGGLYEAIARHHVDQVAGAIDRGLAATGSPRDRLRLTIDAFLALVEDEPEIHRFLVARAVPERTEAHRAVSDFVHQLGERIARVLAEEFARLGIDPGPVAPVAHGLVGMVQSATEWWLTDQTAMARGALVDRLERFAWQGLWGLPASTEDAGGAPPGEG